MPATAASYNRFRLAGLGFSHAPASRQEQAFPD
jgi:hypothetical protein